jgi:acyl carrier protein
MNPAALTDELCAQVRKIVADVLETDEDQVETATSFVDEFDADSLQVIEMFARFEKFLGVKVPGEDMIELDNLEAAYTVVAQHLAAETADA